MSVKTAASQTHVFEIKLKPEFADAEGAHAIALLREQGLAALREVRSGKLYELEGPLSTNQAQQVARELLCDPVTQEWRVVSHAPTVPSNGMNFWRVEVWLKPGITDPVGETVRDAVVGLGLPRPARAGCAALYKLSGRAMKPQLEKAVLRCLANPLIHRVVVTEAHP